MTSMFNTPDSPAKTPGGYTTQGGNFWTLITPEIWKVLHAVLHPSYLSAVRRLKKGVSIELGETIYKKLGRDLSIGNLQMFVPVRVRARSSIKTFQAMNASLRVAVFERAGGKCELCRRPAPFLLPSGTPYLEVHHVVPSTSGGEDSMSNLVALCPNCHRKMHFSPTDSDTKKLFTRTTKKT